MTKKTINTKYEYDHAKYLLEQGQLGVKRAGDYCKELITLLDDVEPGACTDAVFGGHMNIDQLLAKLGITVEEK